MCVLLRVVRRNRFGPSALYRSCADPACSVRHLLGFAAECVSVDAAEGREAVEFFFSVQYVQVELRPCGLSRKGRKSLV